MAASGSSKRAGTSNMPGGGGGGKSKAASDATQLYLFLYNIVSAFAWLFIFERVVRHMGSSSSQFSLVPGYFRSHWSDLVTRATTMYSDIGFYVRWIQTGALLEVVHVALGLVRSSLGTTAMQVTSRIWLVWGVCYFFPAVTVSPFYATMVFAWSLTEVVRYSAYAAKLADVNVSALEYIRYSAFYVLYPLGAGSEALLMYASAQHVRAGYGELAMFGMGALILSWPPGLAVMMGHMHQQRRKYLGGKRKGKKRA